MQKNVLIKIIFLFLLVRQLMDIFFTKEMLIKMRGLDVVGFKLHWMVCVNFTIRFVWLLISLLFDEILKRINLICDILEDANVKIRINYDDKNFDPNIFLEQISSRIDEKHKQRISFLLRKVWQVENSDENKAKNIYFVQEAKKQGYKVLLKLI